MASYSARTKGATTGATAGAKIGSMIAPGIGTVIGGALGGIAGFLSGRGADSAFDRRQKKIRDNLTGMQTELSGRVPEILDYYKNLEAQSYREDEIKNTSTIDAFLQNTNRLFSSGQQAMAKTNLAYGGPLAKDIENNYEQLFAKYRTANETRELASDRDIAAIGMAQTEAVEKVDNLIEQLEIDKLKYS